MKNQAVGGVWRVFRAAAAKEKSSHPSRQRAADPLERGAAGPPLYPRLGQSAVRRGQVSIGFKRLEIAEVAAGLKNSGLLDYVAGWYLKAADYIRDTDIPVAFVSTNSITQGEQVGVLWSELLGKRGISIYFDHRTFAWDSEARGKAHVHVVIVGFGLASPKTRWLFDYETLTSDPTVEAVANISPYLVPGPNVALSNRSRPLCDVPEIGIGNKPIDDGNYLFDDAEKAEFVRQEPASKAYFKRWYGSWEFINNEPRWRLWLGEAAPSELRAMPKVMERIEAVKKFRLASKSAPTQKLANTPTRFHVENMPKGNYLLIPEVSSERRPYIPMGFMKSNVLCSNLVKLLPKATLYHFGVLTSSMHMAWVRQVAGRLKSDFRYSAKLVYNNFPWPRSPSEAQRKAVEVAAQAVLNAREAYANASLADLYDPLAMPADLSKAHSKLDRAVERCYRDQSFPTERGRVEFLFELYQELSSPLLGKKPRPRKHR